MVNFPSAHDSSTPQRRPSDPTWSTRTPSASVFKPRSTLHTPRSGKKPKCDPRLEGIPKSRISPYMTPENVKVTYGGELRPMDVFTPKEMMEARLKEAQRRKAETATSSPMGAARARPLGSKPKTLVFPPNFPSHQTSPPLVPPPMQGTPRRVERPWDPSRPTIQLLRVMRICWDADSEKESSWTLTNELLNGRNDERDRSARWNTLGCAVGNVWPDLRHSIMRNTPRNGDETWFTSAERGDVSDAECIHDPTLATKDSTLDRVGFNMSSKTYDAACKLIRQYPRFLADSGLNPFFMIYASADCGVPLPDDFNRQLLWTHLDAILHAKCWRGLGSARVRANLDTSTDARHLPPKFSLKEEDPEGILGSLFKLIPGGFSRSIRATAAVDQPVHQLQIVIKDCYMWMAKAQVGTVWYQAGDLDDDDIPCFAVIDALTRLLPFCRGGVLEILTSDIQLLWGVGGPPSGAWSVVKAICEEYQVKLRGKWTELRGLDPCAKINPAESITPPRDGAVIDAVMNEFMLLESKAAYECMKGHLMTN